VEVEAAEEDILGGGGEERVKVGENSKSRGEKEKRAEQREEVKNDHQRKRQTFLRRFIE